MNDFKEKRTLGRTGLKVSRLGLASGYRVKAVSVEKAFHEHDINYFYWSTPRKKTFGEGLKNIFKQNREKAIICTQTYDHLGWTMKRAVNKGLKSLNTDYIDILLLGWFNKMPSEKILDEARMLKEKGLIRQIAMSGHNRKTFGELAALKK